jgi:hypothetical protein
MKIIRKLRVSPAMVVACIALTIVLGGSSYAAVTALPPNSVTSVQVKDHSLLAKDFKAGQLPRGAVGPAGPAGPPGPAGPAGPAGGAGGGLAVKWALVDPSGKILQQSGGISVSSHSAGQYILDFGAASNAKLIEATPALGGDQGARGLVVAGPCGGTAEGAACSASNDTNHVVVRTYSPSNLSLEDHPFYIAVFG